MWAYCKALIAYYSENWTLCYDLKSWGVGLKTYTATRCIDEKTRSDKYSMLEDN